MIKAVIFDYDGVILDSLYTLFLCWKKISEEFDADVKIKNLKQYKKIFKNDVVRMLKSIGLSGSEIERAKEIYFESLKEAPPQFFEGIKKVLNKLSRKYTLVIVTGSPKEVVEKKLKEEGVLGLFKLIVPIIEPAKNKPNPYHINIAINKLKLRPGDVIYVGDTAEDFQAAKKANIKKIIGVSYGYGTSDSLKKENVTLIVDSPREILNAINKID